ncbi:putative glycosyltransferase [Waddlia chondrophila WSU 86-1044]|uniref:Putative glycosyltransferase n=1 Tax=Waddlia chondrophila (strain ATCC VR-1470 / WSU 86-1044) TaxID=716544 RepID=D6YRV1_WADCW|nr:putative glycosyltransferase [Waddlia chondrophila WSU 86-1044]
MYRYILLSLCIFLGIYLFISSSPLEPTSDPSLTINLFCRLNGHGLSTDAAILTEALTAQGAQVRRVDRKSWKVSSADINIFCEHMVPKYFSKAAKNWFIPNPEWFGQNLEDLKNIDLILCRTKEVERIFNDLGMKTYFLGFTSPDCFQPHVVKRSDQYLHLAGNSTYKGTDATVKAWMANQSFPLLTVISKKKAPPSDLTPNVKWEQKYVSKEELLDVLNRSAIHLCPSEAEGFGHYISEAMSCGAVVVTTDAPPMNEFIRDPRFLIPYESASKHDLAMKYYVSAADVEAKVREITQLSPGELKAVGEANRQRYLEMKKNFEENIEQLIAPYARG